jgi:flagellin
MSLSILTNISALMAQSQLSSTQANLQAALTQLSSGLRINSGADDPASLSIANGLQANIVALTQSCQNASDGIGLLQTADGALSQATEVLNRAIALATEASSSGLSPAQATALNTEFQSILNTIDNIGSATNFNGSQVFTANPLNIFLSDGTSGNNLLGGSTMSVGTLSTDELQLGGTSPISASNALTLTSNVASGSVTVGTQIYTFTTNPTSGNNVQIGGTAADTLTNLAAAVNANNTSATAVASGNSITFSATAPGSSGNGVTTTSSLIAAAGTSTVGNWTTTGSIGYLGGGAEAAYAKSSLTLTSDVADGSTVMLGGRTYTFQTAAPSAPGQVQIADGDIPTTLQNLANAVNGTDSVHTPVNASATATVLGSTITFTAASIGSNSNNVGASSNLTTAASSSPWLTMQGTNSLGGASAGAQASASLTLTYNVAAGSTVNIGNTTYRFTTGASSGTNVQIGGTAADTLANLASAVNGNGSDTSVNASASGNVLSLNATSTGSTENNLAANSNLLVAASPSPATWTTTGSLGNLGGGTGGASAQGLLSLLNIANLSSGAQVSIGNVVYTFQTAAPTQAGQVQIASTGLQTFQNLAAAINGTGLNSQNPSVTAGNAYVWLEEDNGTTYDLIQLTALNPGQSGNSIQESNNALFNSSGAWTYGFSGGVNGTGATGSLTLTSNVAAGSTVNIGKTTYTFTTGASSGTNVQLGGTAADTLTNLANAVNGNGSDTSVHASASGNTLSLTSTSTGVAANGLAAIGNLAAQVITGSWSTIGNTGSFGGGADATFATGSLSLMSIPETGSTVTIGSQSYTLTSGTPTTGQVQIGSNPTQTLQNLAAAISGDSNNAVNASVSASASGTTINLTAKNSGISGNALAADGTLVTSGGSTGSWSTTGATGFLGGGITGALAHGVLALTANPSNGNAVTIGTQTYTFTTGTAGAGQVQIGIDAAQTLQNLVAAVNGDVNNGVNTSAVASFGGGSGNNASINLVAIPNGAQGNSVVASGNLFAASGGGGSDGSWSNAGSTSGGSDASGSVADLLSPTDAQAALLAANNAVNLVAAMRGSVGAFINQLQAASSVMTTQTQNLTSAESGITSADIGETVARTARYSILQSTGLAALRMSNQMQQSILKLLQ